MSNHLLPIQIFDNRDVSEPEYNVTAKKFYFPSNTYIAKNDPQPELHIKDRHVRHLQQNPEFLSLYYLKHRCIYQQFPYHPLKPLPRQTDSI